MLKGNQILVNVFLIWLLWLQKNKVETHVKKRKYPSTVNNCRMLFPRQLVAVSFVISQQLTIDASYVFALEEVSFSEPIMSLKHITQHVEMFFCT